MDSQQPSPCAPRAPDPQCVICFEALEHVVALPCDCRVDYCSSCWDRALAHSFNACGQARCPTCRGPVRVDFDAQSGRLVFSRDPLQNDAGAERVDAEAEAEAAEGAAGDAAQDAELPAQGELNGAAQRMRRTRDRLIQQARPAQVQILQRYGSARPSLQRAVAECDGAVAKAPRLAQDALEVALAEQCALAALAPPKCVCGGLLERLSNDERVRRVFRRHLPHVEDGTPQFELFVARLLDEGISVCSCDLCFTEIKPPGKVWTCENGSRTILHANAYDVCEACFLRHAGCQATAGPQLA